MAPPSPELFLAVNCTNVGVGPGGTTNLLAKVSIVNYRGDAVYDSFVIPTTMVTDYRTATTGITAAHLTSENSRSFTEVQNAVANRLRNRIIVGYCLWNDLAVLGLPHPAVNTRDVALYLPFRNSLNSGNHIPGLQTLAQRFLGRNCQQGHIEPVSITLGDADQPIHPAIRPRTPAFVWTSIVQILNGKPQSLVATGPALSRRVLSRVVTSDAGLFS